MPASPFLGSEALASGSVQRQQLRTRFTRLHPDVYLDKRVAEPSLEQRIHAAWLWSGRRGVIAGSAAAALHGTSWVKRDAPIELIHSNPRGCPGIITRRDLLHADEVVTKGRLTVTTPERTGFDLGRRGGAVSVALARVDALMRATPVTPASIAELATRHPHCRGLRQLETVLDLADAGAQSPKESWLRWLLVHAGLPRPQTQIPVLADDGIPGGYPVAFLDLGWPDLMIAVEYDGDHHRSDRRQYVKDIRRREMLERKGWIVITVVAEDSPYDIVARVRAAFEARLSVR